MVLTVMGSILTQGNWVIFIFLAPVQTKGGGYFYCCSTYDFGSLHMVFILRKVVEKSSIGNNCNRKNVVSLWNIGINFNKI